MDESSLFARPQNPIIIWWSSTQPVVYHHHMICLDNTDRDDLHRKLEEIADKPTQRLMVGILYMVGVQCQRLLIGSICAGTQSTTGSIDVITSQSITPSTKTPHLTALRNSTTIRNNSSRTCCMNLQKTQGITNLYGCHSPPGSTGGQFQCRIFGATCAGSYERGRDVMADTPPQPASADPEEREQFSEHFQDEWKERKEANYTAVVVDQTRKTVGADLYRAWFQEGERVSLPVSASRKGMNLLGAVTSEGETVFLESGGSFTGEGTIHLLEVLQEKFGEKITVVWDNASYFTAKVVKDFVEETPIKVFQLPTGSPDMNPAEGCGQQFKQNLGNRYFGNLDGLREAIWPVLSSILAVAPGWSAGETTSRTSEIPNGARSDMPLRPAPPTAGRLTCVDRAPTRS